MFNGSDYDRDVIAWTRAQPNTECVVLDGPDKGMATFVGRALVASDYFAYLDDDDELLDGALERRAQIMRDRPDLDCVATNGYYVQGTTTRLMFEHTKELRQRGYVQSLLDAQNWLASCGGLFRTATVKMSYFKNLPPHREWTVIAFRVASSLNVQFEDVPTFRVHSSPGSQSKQDSYVDASIVIYDELKRCTNDARQRQLIRYGQGAAYRSMCSHYRMRRNFPAAWRAYGRAICSVGGWRYLPYIVLLLLQRSEPWTNLIKPITTAVHRLTRNPLKYFRVTWWRPLLRLAWLRVREGSIYTLPSYARSLVRRPGRVLVFPSRMDRYQPAESYIAWKVFGRCDLRICGPSLTRADIAIAWNPSTICTHDESILASLQSSMRVLNARCTDIRKSTVGRHFRKVFGYSLEVDPLTYNGTILRKSEKNGTHDATLLEGPLRATEPGYVYQRLVTCETERGAVEWRVFIVGKKPVAVYRLYAPRDDRFAYFSAGADVTTVEAAFSKQERARMAEFCDSIGLDFGALDVLRDGPNGRIYVCDCNNTPTGPSAKLQLRDHLRIVGLVSNAFRREYLTPVAEYQPGPSALPVREAVR